MGRVSMAPLALLALAACGGYNGVQSASTCAISGPTCTAGGTPTPTPSAPTYTTVVDPTGNSTQSYTEIGGTHQLVERTVSPGGLTELYIPEQRVGGITVSYDPRGAAFTVSIDQASAAISGTFQDPAHRTYYGGSQEPQPGAPDDRTFRNGSVLNYLETGERTQDSVHTRTFFYQTPGSNTRYVSLAGYLRTFVEGIGSDEVTYTRTQSAFVFGNQTAVGDMPTSGSGRYAGNMLATMSFNDEIDNPGSPRTRLEWISGTAGVDVNFGAGTVTANFTGSVLDTAPVFADLGPLNRSHRGETFTATGTASFDTDRRGYTGKIANASLGASTVSIVGSSLDGTFFGPKAAETGGAFRVIGGIPDQRVDIIGAFTGAKPAQ